jgi:membrane peptidoglycan carboxypeptidase
MSILQGKLFKIGVFTIGGGFILGVLGFAYAYFSVSIPDPNAFVNSQSTIIQYADGQEIGRLGSENRQVVKLANIPLHVRQAVMAAEDRNFYTQSAVSPIGIARAFFNNLKSGSLNAQGGSTITQQYAKTAFLTPERTITRKVKELIIAMKLQNQMSKDDILESYLNTIYFGRGSYGIQTASEVYFSKSVSQISISEAAILASILRSPGYYDPSYGKENTARLKARWQYVIDGMVSKEWLTTDAAAKLKYPAIRERVTSGALAGPKGYVMSWVVRELEKLGFTESQLQTGGYVIKTTLIRKNQEASVRAMDARGPKNTPENFNQALVSIRPGTGEIVALYGGKDYLVKQLNGATQSITQAGSSFKPFALIAALEQGIPLSSVWSGVSPQVFDDVGKPYPVFNYSNEQEGEIDLTYATAHSINTVYVPLGIAAGLENVVDVARRAGIPTSVALMPTPSISLGVASPHVIDMAAAYATFAANGIYATPFIIKEVLGSNKGVLYEGKIQAQQVFQPDVMADLTYALSQGTLSGTGVAASSGVGRPTAGKTGTTTDNASAWFNGYTADFATTVTMFMDNATQSLNGIGGNYAFTGGTFPAQVWNTYTKLAQKGMPVIQFPEPAYIGGTDPVSYLDAVPTLDPELAGKYESGATKKKKLAARQ